MDKNLEELCAECKAISNVVLNTDEIRESEKHFPKFLIHPCSCCAYQSRMVPAAGRLDCPVGKFIHSQTVEMRKSKEQGR